MAYLIFLCDVWLEYWSVFTVDKMLLRSLSLVSKSLIDVVMLEENNVEEKRWYLLTLNVNNGHHYCHHKID